AHADVGRQRQGDACRELVAEVPGDRDDPESGPGTLSHVPWYPIGAGGDQAVYGNLTPVLAWQR
ncbi:MAG: hypothetical protein JWM84_2374, partial [Nocardioides sp.]|nr:hypothetical protein [Nocardioides sp.]